MKIAMIGHKRIPSREGGIEIVVEEISKRMAAEGHIVDAYNRKGHHVSGKEFDGKELYQGVEHRADHGSEKNYKGIHIIKIPTLQNSKLNALVYSILGTVRALFGHYDVIHFHAEGPCAMLWLPHLFGIRTVATIHGLDWKRSKWGGFASRYLKAGEKIAAKYADEIIVLSKNIQLYFLTAYQRDVKCIPNGIVRPERKGIETIRVKWGLEKDGYLLFLARIVPEKGLHYLIDAYKETNTSKKLVIAGGSSHTDGYMADIKRKAGGDGRILFTDFVQGEELEALYSNAYIYVLPSDLEGMPLSLLEAMSYGNCCLVSDIAECIEVVEDRAVSFRHSDVKDLKDKLTRLIENPWIVERYKKDAADFVCGKYNWDDVTKSTIRLYYQ